MDHRRPPHRLDPCVEATGRWLAHAERFLRAHPKQMLAFGVQDGVVNVRAEPYQTSPITGHERMRHHAVFDPTRMGAIFPKPRTGIKILFSLKTSFARLNLDGSASLEQGETNLHNGLEAQRDCVGHILALTCLALSGTSVYHQALLWAITGGGGSDVAVYPNRLENRVAHTISAMKNPQLYDNTMGHHRPTLSLPQLTDAEDRDIVGRWLTRTIADTRMLANAAFDDERALLYAEPST